MLGTVAAVVGAVSLSSCIEETEPTDVATQEQIQQSSSASEALLMAMPASMNTADASIYSSKSWHVAFGYGAMMYIRDCETGDFGLSATSYSHWTAFSHNRYLGQDYLYMQYVWNYYYEAILSTNNVIGGVDPESATSDQLGALGAGYAFRAMLYLDLARCYEFLPNDKTSNVNADGHDVLNLTVPIVTADMDQESARNNPRADREAMGAFIEEDLNKAEEYIVNLSGTQNNTLPTLACVYGLKARLYMWLEDYANAQKYARLAINNASVSPMSEDDCLDETTGFNDISKWMWGGSLTSEDDQVQTGIVNRVSWISNQTSFGYTGYATGMYLLIDKSMYDRISDTDFRKLEFVAPEGSALASKVRMIPGLTQELADAGASLPEYAAVKFRPNEGDFSTYSTGAAAAYPIMRVEEMYFIEAEAAAHQNVAEGLQLLTSFMAQYRDPNYTTTASSVDDVVEEIVFQKRVELWGEGQSFFDIKRLNLSVTRNYDGSWWLTGSRFNTDGRPAWMNWVIVKSEGNNNEAVNGYNNPDPSDAYTSGTAN